MGFYSLGVDGHGVASAVSAALEGTSDLREERVPEGCTK